MSLSLMKTRDIAAGKEGQVGYMIKKGRHNSQTADDGYAVHKGHPIKHCHRVHTIPKPRPSRIRQERGGPPWGHFQDRPSLLGSSKFQLGIHIQGRLAHKLTGSCWLAG
jgi:hypothetical protein